MLKVLLLAATASALNVAPMRSGAVARASAPRMAVGLIYSTTTGNTETVAGYIAAKTGLEMVDIGDLDGDSVAAYDGLIIGAPTRSARAPRGTTSSTATSRALTS